jgi:polyisoprenyl-phosphate glycosyltransferase
MDKEKISAIVACYNDGQAIPFMHERLKAVFNKLDIDYEIIFVNDGSPDNTEEILKKIIEIDNKVIGVNHSRNFGSQMAFTSGMEIAAGNCIVFLDGDLQDPPEIIEDFYKKRKEGYDVVYGIRVKRETSLVMQFCYKAFYRIFKKLSYISIPLDAGDFSLIDRKVVEALKQFPERDRFLRGLRAWVGFKQTGVPYIRPERMFGKTTNSLLKNLNWASRGIFSFSYIPLSLINFISFFIFIISVISIIITIILRLTIPASAPRGITMLLIVILFLGSLQLLVIGILGEYIGKIFEEVKQRPKFIVKDIYRSDKQA